MTTHIVCHDCEFEAIVDDDEAERTVGTHENATGHNVDDDDDWVDDDSEYVDPLEAIDGETEVEISCGVVGDAIPECDGWSETIELDEPANYTDGKIELPGFDWECPECGNPHEFVVDGIRVTNLV